MSPSNATAKLMKSAFDILASPKLKCFDKALSKGITLKICAKHFTKFYL